MLHPHPPTDFSLHPASLDQLSIFCMSRICSWLPRSRATNPPSLSTSIESVDIPICFPTLLIPMFLAEYKPDISDKFVGGLQEMLLSVWSHCRLQAETETGPNKKATNRIFALNKFLFDEILRGLITTQSNGLSRNTVGFLFRRW